VHTEANKSARKSSWRRPRTTSEHGAAQYGQGDNPLQHHRSRSLGQLQEVAGSGSLLGGQGGNSNGNGNGAAHGDELLDEATFAEFAAWASAGAQPE
jgi:hypothetical protein